ncbi:hypothetical protein PSN45_004076 [Yamadazyma tenuis]|uniref:uncharacterized protein n=1 Tax=Candida tenuis TaxID=2315449 RepID=UPI0027A41C9E|nr:hypothetical protein PSN45_004076 [Yamadazyma tenuis]
MAVPFPDIDPYEVLGVSNTANPIEVKRAYKKLSLKYHPDKLRQQQISNNNGDDTNDLFPKIQFAYSVLSDHNRRQRYDATGSLAELEEGEDSFDWKEYFNSLNEKITVEMIEEDRLKYQNSEEERSDILQNILFYEGDFLKLFEVIPHLEFDEREEERVFVIVEELEQQFPQEFSKNAVKSIAKYQKSRKTKVKNQLKKLAKEAKEAEKLEKLIKGKHKGNDLQAIIRARQSSRMDDLISNLESKYVDKKGKKRSNVSDDEFNRIQQGLLNKKKKRV